MITLRIFRWRDYPRLSRRTLNAITNVLIRGRQKEISYSQKRKRHTEEKVV